MYSWIFRHIPGPTWMKVIVTLLLVTAVIFVLFEFVYPMVHEHYFDNTVT